MNFLETGSINNCFYQELHNSPTRPGQACRAPRLSTCPPFLPYSFLSFFLSPSPPVFLSSFLSKPQGEVYLTRTKNVLIGLKKTGKSETPHNYCLLDRRNPDRITTHCCNHVLVAICSFKSTDTV